MRCQLDQDVVSYGNAMGNVAIAESTDAGA
jgi:hypothetical protein